MKFSIKENADLVTFTEEILTEKFFVQWTYKRLSPTISISFADTCTETYPEHLQTSKMECWSTIVSIFYPLTIGQCTLSWMEWKSWIDLKLVSISDNKEESSLFTNTQKLN